MDEKALAIARFNSWLQSTSGQNCLRLAADPVMRSNLKNCLLVAFLQGMHVGAEAAIAISRHDLDLRVAVAATELGEQNK